MACDQLSGLDRVIRHYNQVARRLERDAIRHAITEYDRGRLAGLGQAIFDLTGDWPHERRDVHVPRFPRPEL